MNEKFNQIELTLTINKTKIEVWDVLFNRFHEVNNFNPLIEASESISEINGEIGAERSCQLNDGNAVLERITAAEPNESFHVEIYDGGLPMMDKMLARFDLIETNKSETRVNFTLNYSTKPKFLGWLMKGMIAKQIFPMLKGLKYYLETGDLVNQKNIKSILKNFDKLENHEAFLKIA